VIQFVGVTLILLFLMSNFGTFIDFATSAGFISAPALTYYNYRAVTSVEIAKGYQPTRSLLVWHWIGFAAMLLFAAAFLVERFT
jgi:Mn2+/Fe2+ NRAMP family transporter